MSHDHVGANCGHKTRLSGEHRIHRHFDRACSPDSNTFNGFSRTPRTPVVSVGCTEANLCISPGLLIGTSSSNSLRSRAPSHHLRLPKLSLSVGLMPEPLLTTHFDLAAAIQDAFSEQERILDEIEKAPILTQGTRFKFPSPPSFYSAPAVATSPLTHVPRPPLAPTTNSTAPPPPTVQSTRLKRKNEKRRASNAAREKEAGTHGPWREKLQRKKVHTSLSHAVNMEFPLSGFSVSKDDGLTGTPRCLQRGDRAVRTLEDFRRMGFSIIEWDGVFVLCLHSALAC